MKINTRRFSQSLGLALLLAAAASVSAQTVRGPNGHFYTLVSAPGISWPAAHEAAEASLRNGQPGHLVTITSQEEQDFLVGTFGAGALETKWMGLFQPVPEDAETGWEWVTGEPFNFTDWSAGEPNNGNYGPVFGFESVGLFWAGGRWNDAPPLWNYGAGAGYVVEWDVDATVIIDGCDTGVLNAVVDAETLSTISDLISQCAAGATNHGGFVSCVAKVTNALKKAGMITGDEKDAIQSCAAESSIP
jgi:hypothetical protein